MEYVYAAMLLHKAKKEINDVLVIFDEGHNLSSRCRDLLSSQISSYVIDKAAKEKVFAKKKAARLKSRLAKKMNKTKLR